MLHSEESLQLLSIRITSQLASFTCVAVWKLILESVYTKDNIKYEIGGSVALLKPDSAKCPRVPFRCVNGQ